jgi:bifunctional polynucleotide phosphatase/kinase
MCGFPGCGKSTVVATLGGFTPVSNDTLGTKSKCIKATKELMLQNKNIVVDNNNLSLANRIEYYKLAREWIVSKKGNPYNILVIHINNNIQFCYYMNQLRCQLSNGGQKLVPKIAYHTIKKRAEFPVLSEYDNIKIITHTSMFKEYKYQFPPL